MQKLILIDYDKCTGCKYCETVCAVKHEGVCNPFRARIKVLVEEITGFLAPTLCQQCMDAPCVEICPRQALSRDEEFGRVNIDHDLCIGCKSCILICPFGAMKFDEVRKKPVKCDFCDGDPECVKACSTGALRFMNATEANLVKKRELMEKLAETAKRYV